MLEQQIEGVEFNVDIWDCWTYVLLWQLLSFAKSTTKRGLLEARLLINISCRVVLLLGWVVVLCLEPKIIGRLWSGLKKVLEAFG